MPDQEHMMRRQQVLADFGEFALCSENLNEVLTEACRLVGEALGTKRAKVLEIREDGQSLFVRAGIGWDHGVVGQLRLPMSEHSSETFAIKAGKPVITQDIAKEERFEVPEFMKAAGVVALVNVPISLPGQKVFGLLQVDATEPRDFAQNDIAFLRTYATILGPVIDRLFKVHDLQVALDANKHLMQELQHRIKNHIGIISSLLCMRSGAAHSEETRRELAAVSERVEALRLVHELLYSANTAERLRLRPYVTQLVENLGSMQESQSGRVRLDVEVEDVDLGPDTAVPLGLILTEFVTNSLKHAFDGQGGVIAIKVEAVEQGAFRVRVSDNGKGLPSEPRPAKPGSGTGMRLIKALAYQIGASPIWTSASGTALCLEFTPRCLRSPG